MFYIFACVCLLYFIWVLYSKKLRFEPPVLPGGVPIFGHLLWTLGNSVDVYNCIKRFSEESQAMGGVFRSYFGPIMMYGVTDADDALTISNVCLEKHSFYNIGKGLLKNGLLTADVPTWKKNRKLLNPAFHHQVLVSLLDTFNNQSRRLLENLTEKEGKPFDHDEIIRLNNLETICVSAFGADAKEFGELQEQYLPHWNIAVKLIDDRFRKPWLLIDFIFKMTSTKILLDKCVEMTSNLANSIIQRKINDMKNAKITGNDDHLNPFIKTILKGANEGNLSDDDIQGEIYTIIAAGHDTTATTMTIVLTLLGSHPEVQEKAYQEILQVVGDSDRNLDKADLAQLTYVEATLKETLRLYPIVPVIMRQIDHDVKLKNCTLKEGHGCFISLHGILRDKAWGPDRHEFRPDRWLEKDTLPDPKYYTAFSLGRRFCIGRTYAMMSMKVSLAHVLRQYKISSDVSKMEIGATYVIKPASGHDISLQKRN